MWSGSAHSPRMRVVRQVDAGPAAARADTSCQFAFFLPAHLQAPLHQPHPFFAFRVRARVRAQQRHHRQKTRTSLTSWRGRSPRAQSRRGSPSSARSAAGLPTPQTAAPLETLSALCPATRPARGHFRTGTGTVAGGRAAPRDVHHRHAPVPKGGGPP